MDKAEKKIYNAILSGSAICTDSREAKNNTIFFALKGENFDGNNFANDAINKGCEIAVVDDPKIVENDKFVLVPDVLKTLHSIALSHRNIFNIPFIGITGTNGKTTTKELISTVLGKKYKTYATKGNYNNHIGVPITILSIKNDAEIAVVEMGANHVGEIHELCQLAKPSYGIITNIGKAHLEGFKNIENITKAKSELYEYIKNNNGKVFVNYDDPKLFKLSGNLPKITYGKSQNADYFGEIHKTNKFLKITFSCKKSLNKKYVISSNVFGNYNFENIMAAISVGSYFGVEKEDIKKAIESYIPTNNRSQLIETDRNTILMDAYNANPTSMNQAIEAFYSMNLANKVVILGDMLELGEDSKKEHAKILNEVLKQKYDKILLVGKEFSAVAKNGQNLSCFYDNKEIITWLKHNPLSNSNILIKASRGVGLEKIIDYL